MAERSVFVELPGESGPIGFGAGDRRLQAAGECAFSPLQEFARFPANTYQMTHNRYSRNVGAVYSLQYHLVFCPKYRRKVLVGEIAEALKSLLAEKAGEQGWEIKTMEVMPDHVHLFLAADPTDAPQRIVSYIKGFTSRLLRTQFPSLESRLPTLWSRSYFIASVGDVSASAIQRYIEAQKGR